MGERAAHVRYWPKADIAWCAAHVRFRGKADKWMGCGSNRKRNFVTKITSQLRDQLYGLSVSKGGCHAQSTL